ncbi:histidine--tRNA ligase [Candidatus Giovannonibacteria bacterium]|nr:histidine--tRNA ligase [Candidatus Giovannonibacteria bacterium]
MPKKLKQKKEMVRSPKGMRDMLVADIRYKEKILEKAREIAEFYGFQPIKTPHLEHTELFERPLGDASDVVEKQMYTLKTKGGDSLTLRPEGTAPIVRAYAENGMVSWPHPVKLYYSGSFFRHENPQKGRLREFHQFGIELLGDHDAIMDALAIKVLYLAITELGLKNILVHINSIGDRVCRPQYKKELTAYYRKKINYICKDCKRRLKDNPLRLLDCKDPGCQEQKAGAPQMVDFLCEECKTHFREVLEFLDEAGIPYTLDHNLVRGFDYYGRTVFELFLERGAKEKGQEKEKIDAVEAKPENGAAEEPSSIALGGGGRYDELMYILGGRPLPAAGGGLGVERIIHEMKLAEISPKIPPEPKVFLIQIGPAAKKRSFMLLEEMRKAGIGVGESLSRDNLRTQLNIAAKVGAKISLILGQKEAMTDSIILRYMDEGVQETVLQKKMVERIKEKLKKMPRTARVAALPEIKPSEPEAIS